jgi:hypothetical protein
MRLSNKGLAVVVTERDEMDAWRAANPEAALNEAISLAIGAVITHEPDEAKRKAAIDVLIECHRRALAAFEPERRQRLN